MLKLSTKTKEFKDSIKITILDNELRLQICKKHNDIIKRYTNIFKLISPGRVFKSTVYDKGVKDA